MYSVTTARHATLVFALATCLLLVPGAMATGATTSDGSEALEAVTIDETVDTVENTTNETVNDTTDTVENTTNETVNETGDSVENTTDGTVNDTTDTVENTTSDTVEAVENTTAETVEIIGDTTDETLDGADDLSGDGTVAIAGADTTLSTELDTPDASLFDPSTEDGAEPDGTPVTEPSTQSVDGVALAGSGDDDTDGDDGPLPDVPPGGLVGGLGLAGLAAAVVLRQGAVLPHGNLSTAAKTAISPAVVAGSDLLDRLLRTFYPLRYSRYDESDPLEHDARREMLDAIQATPGTYLSEVSERAGLPLSTARHHVRVLEREGLVASAKVRGRRRFYPDEVDGLELAAAMNDEATASLLDALARVGPASVSGLAEELEKDPSTISHHLSRLEEDGVVVRERDGRAIRNRLAPEAAEALEPDVEAEGRQEQPVSAD